MPDAKPIECPSMPVGERQFQVKMFATAEQFKQVCPDAVMVTGPKLSLG